MCGITMVLLRAVWCCQIRSFELSRVGVLMPLKCYRNWFHCKVVFLLFTIIGIEKTLLVKVKVKAR